MVKMLHVRDPPPFGNLGSLANLACLECKEIHGMSTRRILPSIRLNAQASQAGQALKLSGFLLLSKVRQSQVRMG